MRIKQIKAREILDSRGNPTVEVEVILKNKIKAKAAVPSGASTGKYEALELRDGDQRRYSGQGVLQAVSNVNQEIAPVLINKKVIKQRQLDELMLKLDDTQNKSRLGANAILGVSLACARAGALAKGLPLYRYLAQIFNFPAPQPGYRFPIPMFNIFNGGKHADTNLDFQEFMIIPKGIKRFSEKVRAGSEIFHALGQVLLAKGLDTDVGNEGGYAPDISATTDALDYIIQAIKKAGYQPGQQIFLATDIGASELYRKKTKEYLFKLDNQNLDREGMINLNQKLVEQYPFISLEDPLDQDDWLGWQEITSKLGKKAMIVGDDLFATNKERLAKGTDMKAANSILIKVNQVGTLSETIDCLKLAQDNNYKIVVSHRSGETTDDFIADLAVAVKADYVKMGSLSRGERVCKYNRLMEIEEEIK